MSRHTSRQHADGRNHTVCEGTSATVAEVDASALLSSIPGWELHDGRLHRTFRCETFLDSIDFVSRMAKVAEDINHHPEFCLTDKRNVSVVIWTHQLNALTSLDFDLAASVNAAYADGRQG